jgi:hypothetical protein
MLDGEPTAPFVRACQFARKQTIFGQATQFYGWHYPPFFLNIAALLAAMPNRLTLILRRAWQLFFYLLSLRAIPAASCPLPQGEEKTDRPVPQATLIPLAVLVMLPAVFLLLRRPWM